MPKEEYTSKLKIYKLGVNNGKYKREIYGKKTLII